MVMIKSRNQSGGISLGLLIGLLVILVGGYAVYNYSLYQKFLQQPLDINAKGLEYTVIPGASMRKIARELHEKGVLEKPIYLVFRARVKGVANAIKVGEYKLTKGTTPDGLLDQLVKGKVKLYSLTLIEGWTFRDVMKAVNKHPQLRHTIVHQAGNAVMKTIGHAGEHPEGRFYPDTYRFPAGTRDIEFLQRAYRHMSVVLNKAWASRVKGLPLKTPYEALILASIIEKETARKDEYRKIAGVFIRRLKKKMRLQTDPTVIYGLGDSYNGNIKRKHLRQDTPYNTYTRAGLPPTPIALPGSQAISAALNPESGDSLYFVATGKEGRHYFSRTLKEHNEAVIRYQLNGNHKRGFSSRPLPAK